MKTTAVTRRLAGLGGAKWEIHLKAKELINQGRDIVILTIGEPDVPTPDRLIEIAMQSMRKGRTGYSDGRGEKGLRFALAERALVRTGENISADQVMCFPVPKPRFMLYSWGWLKLVMTFWLAIRCTPLTKASSGRVEPIWCLFRCVLKMGFGWVLVILPQLLRPAQLSAADHSSQSYGCNPK